jgi:hypothetical protein
MTPAGPAYGVVPMESVDPAADPAPAAEPAASRDRAGVAALARELLPRLRRWTADSWALPAAGGGTRAEAMAAVVQRLADAGADAERQPRRAVPRLADVNLADQLTVMVEDILRTGDPVALRIAAAELAGLRTALGYR